MKTWFLLATGVMLMSFSCSQPENAVEPTDVKQVLGNWRLVQPTSTFATTLTIDVDQYSGGTISGIYSLKLTGKAAVNAYFASARLINWATGSVEMSAIGTTKIGGSAEAMQFEQTYYGNLNGVNRYELTDKNRLRFYYEGGVLIYEKTN